MNEGADRRRFVRALLGVDAASGMVFHIKMLSGDEELGKEIWEAIFKIVQMAGGLPGVIEVRSSEIMAIVTPAMEELLVEVVRTENLDALDEAKVSLTGHLNSS